MRLLRVLDLARVLPRRGRDVLAAVELRRLCPGGGDATLGQGGGVGSHVGDVAVLVQPLRDAHGALGRVPELAAGLLLEGRGHERRVGAPCVGLGLDGVDDEVGTVESPGQRAGRGLVEHDGVLGCAGGLQPAVRAEVTALRHPGAIDGGELGREAAWLTGVTSGRALRRQGCGDVPVVGGDERHTLAFTLDDDAGGHRLHTPGGQPRHDLLPQHGRDLVSVETVEDAAGLLGVDEVGVQLAGVLGGGEDGGLGDLVEHHALDGDLGLEHLEEMPGDRLTLAVGVRREQELIHPRELLLELGDLLLLVGADHVDGLEVVLRVHAQPRPRLLLVLGRDVRGALGQVADVTDGSLDHIVGPQIGLDLARLGGGLDDHQAPLAARCCLLARHWSAPNLR